MGCETERTVIRIVTRLVRTMDASSASIISSVSCLSANSVRPGTAPSRTHWSSAKGVFVLYRFSTAEQTYISSPPPRSSV